MRQRGPAPAAVPTPADPARAASVRAIAEQFTDLRGPLLPILHAVVATHGHIDDDDIPVIADVLNLSRADVHGVVTFYHDFRRTPPVAHRVSLCRGEACQARGAQASYTAATNRWSAADDVEVTEVFCLGLCAQGPSGQIDGTLHTALTPERIEALTTGWQA